MAQTANLPEIVNLPGQFCVETHKGNRRGYGFLQAVPHVFNPTEVVGAELTGIYTTTNVLKPINHENHYFRIQSSPEYVIQHRSLWRRTMTRKGHGNVNRITQWRNTGTALRYAGVDYPVIRFTAHATVIPVIPTSSFIPLIVENNATEVPAIEILFQAPVAQAPVAQAPVQKRYPMMVIPQHTVRALLRDAAMQEEQCPITGGDIDITNGAVTSCFHIFDRGAINTWIRMPTSRDKCPVCNTPCNVYTLDEPPPLG